MILWAFQLFTILSVIDGVPQNFGQYPYSQDQGMQSQNLTALFEYFCFKMRPFLKVKLQSFLCISPNFLCNAKIFVEKKNQNYYTSLKYVRFWNKKKLNWAKNM